MSQIQKDIISFAGELRMFHFLGMLTIDNGKSAVINSKKEADSSDVNINLKCSSESLNDAQETL